MRLSRLTRSLWGVTLLLVPACAEGSFIDEVVIVNDTNYTANVDVQGKDSGWLALVTVGADEMSDVEHVRDQGESWVFRFTYGAHDPVEIEISRKELIDSNWKIAVPGEFEEELRNEGVPPPP